MQRITTFRFHACLPELLQVEHSAITEAGGQTKVITRSHWM